LNSSVLIHEGPKSECCVACGGICNVTGRLVSAV
jgi:hypothetical protein